MTTFKDAFYCGRHTDELAAICLIDAYRNQRGDVHCS